MMRLVTKAGNLDAGLEHDPWALLRRTTHSKCEPRGRCQSPDPQAAKGTWLEWQGAWSCAGLGGC